LTDLASTREIGLLFGADRRLPARPTGAAHRGDRERTGRWISAPAGV